MVQDILSCQDSESGLNGPLTRLVGGHPQGMDGEVPNAEGTWSW